MMVLWRLSWKEFLSRPLRTLLTLSSIVIGVGAVVAVALAIENTHRAQRNMLESVAGRTALEIYSEGNAPFEDSVLEKIRQVPGVKLAAGLIRRYSVMFHGEKKQVKVQFLGVDPKIDQEIREYEIVAGEGLYDYEQALIDRSFARSLGIELGQQVKFSTRSGLRAATIVGIIEPQSGSAVIQGGLIVLPIPTAQQWSRANGRVDVIQVVAKDDFDSQQLMNDVEAILPEGLKVKVPTLRSDLGQESTTAMDQGLRMASAFSLMIAIFIIYNTFQMNVGERRRQFGILRALGTTRQQVIRLIVGEGLILGVVGTLLGWVVGIAATRWLSQATGVMLDIEVDRYAAWSWFPFALAAVCGVGVALLGAYFPARRASCLSPSEAMRVVAAGELEPSNIALAYIGGLLSTVGLVVLILCISGTIHINHAIAGCIAFLLGGIIALPTFLETLSQWVLRWFHGILGVEGRLAQRQLLRHRGRSSLTIGILFIALSTGLGMACTILDNIRDVRLWSEEALLGDFFVRATMPSMATGAAADMPSDLIERIAKIDGVSLIETLRFSGARANDLAIVVVSREFSQRGRKFFHVVEGKPEDIFDGLQAGKVAIGSVLAERAKLKIGDHVTLEATDQPVDLEIAGIVNDYVAAGLTIYMNRPQAEKLLKVEGHDAIIIDANPNSIAKVDKELRELTEQEGLLLQTQSDLLQAVRAKVDSVVSGLWAVLALGTVIAAFGLVNTLTMNILEQTNEIGVLRVVAMTRQQVRKMILSQAILMGFIGLVPGVLAGLFIAYLLSLSLLPTTGHAIGFVFRPGLILSTFVGEFLVVILASLIPAERATRITIAKAMQYS